MLALLLAGAIAAGIPADPDPRAAAVVDTAIARMGGRAALERIERVRFEMVTQWQRTDFGTRPYADLPSYEFNSDLRDYGLRAWRNTRRSSFAANARAFTDVINDTVAMRNLGQGWAPLNVAYVDERRELFAVAPDRALLLARRAGDLRALPDTTIGALAHARVSATLDGLPATLFIRRGDGFLALVRWRAAQHNDFGLTGWGVMEAEHWYSQWRSMPGGIAYPTQWDVTRVGRPYRRMTLLSVRFDVPATPDSFAISDSLRGAFFASASKPMHDLPLDSARLVEPRLATFGAFGTPAGAVKLGRRWLLLEAGVAPLSVERSAQWLARADAGSSLAGAVITMPMAPTTGGSTWLASQRVPLHVGEGSRRFVEAMLRERKDARAALSPVTSGRWLRVDGDSAWVEPVDLPDFPATLVVWVPALRWVYAGPAVLPLQRDVLLAHARARGWAVERFGSQRALLTPVPGAGVASRMPRDEAPVPTAPVPASTPAREAPPSLPLTRGALLAFAVWSIPAVITVAEGAALSLMMGRPYRVGRSAGEAFAGWWVWALFTPLLVHMARTHRPTWPPRAGVILRHAAAWLVIALAHASVYTVASRLTMPEAARIGGMALWLRSLVAWSPITVLVYAGAIAVLSALALSRAARERERQASELRAELAQAQLSALRMQLHPHFLFNTLHTIGALVREGDRGTALDIIAQLGELLRQVLRADVGHEVTVREEIELLARYLEIEQVRFQDRLRVAWDVAPEVSQARVPTLVLQPLVENAIRHGIARRAGAGRLSIAARARDGRLELAVEDDGPGLPEERRDGVGLANTRARLARLHGERAGVSVENAPAGTGVCARVWLPLVVARAGA